MKKFPIKIPKSRNPIALKLMLKIFKGFKVKPKKGKGSYNRKGMKKDDS